MLQEETYDTLIKLRGYFSKIAASKIKSYYDYGTADYKRAIAIVLDIDNIILDKYTFDTNNFIDFSSTPSN